MEISSALRVPTTPAWPDSPTPISHAATTSEGATRARLTRLQTNVCRACHNELPRRKRMVYLVDGEQVRSLREEKGMSQRQLAEASGVSKKTLANVEVGKVHPLPSTARKIAAALEVDPRGLPRVASRA